MVVPTMKTIIPLDGSDVVTKGSVPKNALCIYRLLSGEVLNYQLIRDGREVFHTYPGEEQTSYEAKMEEIDHELEGLSLLMTEVYTFSGENENNITICGYCGGAHPYTTICEVVITNCAKCGARIQGGSHNCPNQTTTCGRCGASYNPSYGHSCPNPNYCSTCGQSYTGYHYCQGPSPIRCNSCGQYYVGSHTCPGPGQICSKCNTYYVGTHSCTVSVKTCLKCGSKYVGSHNCPGIFCAICGTAPCKDMCVTCGENHCSTNHLPVIPGDPKLKKSIDDILDIIKDTPLAKVFQSYLDNSKINSVNKGGQINIVTIEVYSYKDGTLGFKFNYNPVQINKASELSLNTIIVHELYHIYTIKNNGILSDPNNQYAMNDRDHQNMVNDPDYVKWLKQVVPGRTDDFYNNLRYSGTKGSPAFDSLAEERKKELGIFLKKNKLKNQ